MAPTLLSQAAADPSAWGMGASRPGKFVTTIQLKYKGQQAPPVQLVPSTEMGSVYTPFAPSVFHGTGQEPKQGICFTIPQEVADDMVLLEEAIREQLKATYPNVDSMWFSSVRVSAQYPTTLRAKILVSGREL